ncbi:MAG: flagellin lysine-N-methylase [Oscillospiraceae bacterium]|nr:flagellin lysine-N-methylase [Oscillospiraceae bacterium]
MKHLAPTTFRSFACAAGRCPDSCCRAGWEIIPDEETLKLYQTLPGTAGARVRAGIVPACGDGHQPPAEPAESLLRQDDARVCVLLDPDGLCHVQRNFGHEALCRVCREYPRFHREFGNLTEHGVSLSCPTAYALGVGKPLEWETWEDQAPVVPNDLDPAAYLRLRRGRELALNLLAREELSLERRIELVRRLAAAMQAAPEKRIRHDWALRLRRWEAGIREPGARLGKQNKAFSPGGSRPEGPEEGKSQQRTAFCGAPLERMQNARCRMQNAWVRGNRQLSELDRLAERFSSLELLSPAWGEALERFRMLLRNEAGAQYAPLQTDRPEVYARYLAYSLYKYWLDALDDGNLAGRVERSVSMTLLGLAMDRAFPEDGPFLQRISREVEHSEENLAALLADGTALTGKRRGG